MWHLDHKMEVNVDILLQFYESYEINIISPFYLSLLINTFFFLCKVTGKGKFGFIYKAKPGPWCVHVYFENRTDFVCSETHCSSSELNSENQKTGKGKEGVLWRQGCEKGQEREGNMKKGERNRGSDGFLRNISSWVASLLL